MLQWLEKIVTIVTMASIDGYHGYIDISNILIQFSHHLKCENIILTIRSVGLIIRNGSYLTRY
jgi:hypothetical protein